MKKLILVIFVTLLSSSNLWAQFDTEHWFAPMRDRAGSATQQAVYLSTDKVVPFSVTIYNNNAAIGTVTISKGNPVAFPIPKANIITTSQTDCFTPVTMGIYLLGQEKFYASLRIYSSAHAEIMTSKGKAGIGNSFHFVHAPNRYTTTTITNFTTSVLATEDNTTVTVSGYQPTVQFSNGSTGATNPSMTFTLNKGQSYIIEGAGNIAANTSSFIGAKVVADKAISVTNGNMNGNYAVGSFAGSDIIMDQSVPIERLGKTFAIVKGNGNIGATMEGAIVVATENQTDVFVNGNATAITTLNTGQFFQIPETNFINQGNGHYNMYISTTKNVYIYQLLGGDPDGTDNATEGFNYIPPLSCYLPRRIDEIGLINQIPSTSSPTGTTVPTKLNILTEAGATVTIDGVAPPAGSGPYAITGTTNWVSYSVPNVTGNKTVVSTKALTAGITGGYGTAGYGGYFAGFSSIPAIVKESGTCIPGIVLSVDDIYETYQWFFNGAPISGANTHTYTPTLPGVYTITVSITGCQPVTTPEYNVYPCPTTTTQNINVCGSKVFTPVFTSSTQPIDLNSITVTTPPTNGTATINNLTGQITYVPNAGYLGPDTLVYEFHSTVPTFFDSEIVTVNINVVLLETNDASLTACPYNGVAKYDLTTASVTLFNPVTKKYYPTLTDAQNDTNQITNPSIYISAQGSVYVKVITPEGCFDYSKIDLFFYEVPQVYDATLSECFIDTAPNTAEFDLTTANVTVQPGVIKMYYPSLVDAENNTNEIQNPFSYTTTSTVVYVKVFNSNGCYSIAKITLNIIPPVYSTTLQDKIICVEDRTTLDAGPGFQSYLWNTGATTQTISNVVVGEYWVILHSEGCPTKQFVKVLKSPEPIISNIDIDNNTATLTVVGGQPPYQYSLNNIDWQTSNVFADLPRGQNAFYVKDAYDCNPIMKEITIPNLTNVITPNNDGINDYVDYSELSYKDNLTFSVYDRYGNRVHVGDKYNNYRWDGRFGSKKVITGTYWYQISWNEPNVDKTLVQYKGWILVKNRE